jgi:hypothetical protein
MVLQVNQSAVHVVGAEGAAHTALLPTRTKHEMGDDKLTPARKEIGERVLPIGTIEEIVLLHLDPGQLATVSIDLVALTGELFFLEQ